MHEFLATYHLSGLALGLFTFVIIGVFHPLVIKGEYYLGDKLCTRLFCLLAILSGVASVVCDDMIYQSLLAVVAFSSLWSIGEVKQQRRRVLKGWFPMNPRRKDKYEPEG
ncbi:MAG: DUF4491 family protein [Duncaniella sp.]|nr:DUF4491 family protein [Duncaniella sp.]